MRGASFLGYRLTEPLKVVSGEADLWHLARQSDGKRFVLKLYRHGIRPKKEIVDAFHGLRFEHIVEVLERGAVDGRHYEVQEFIANGSLADLIERGPAADSMTKEIVRELAESLQHLHARNILHRDIKPSNILVRTWAPLDLGRSMAAAERRWKLCFSVERG